MKFKLYFSVADQVPELYGCRWRFEASSIIEEIVGDERKRIVERIGAVCPYLFGGLKTGEFAEPAWDIIEERQNTIAEHSVQELDGDQLLIRFDKSAFLVPIEFDLPLDDSRYARVSVQRISRQIAGIQNSPTSDELNSIMAVTAKYVRDSREYDVIFVK